MHRAGRVRVHPDALGEPQAPYHVKPDGIPAQLSAGDGKPLDVSQARELLEGLCLVIDGSSCVAGPRVGLGEAQVMLQELDRNKNTVTSPDDRQD